MSSNTADSAASRPQRLVRIPTNPMVSRPAQASVVSEPTDTRPPAARPAPAAASDRAPASSPIENIAVDLQGAPGWRLAVIALGVAVVSVIGLIVAS